MENGSGKNKKPGKRGGGTGRVKVLVRTLAALVLAGAVPCWALGQQAQGQGQTQTADAALNVVKPVVKDKDLVIPVAEITTNAVFYPVDVGGTRLEILAVKAPDGTIRTAFNTCQVCYSSGRGFYKQVGTVLVCQNCGNRFRMSQVEVQSGGCNPVPITGDNKVVTDDTITIPLDYMKQAKTIFARWKRS